jgi:hypothetical protein
VAYRIGSWFNMPRTTTIGHFVAGVLADSDVDDALGSRMVNAMTGSALLMCYARRRVMTSIDEPGPDDVPLLSDAIPTREELADSPGLTSTTSTRTTTTRRVGRRPAHAPPVTPVNSLLMRSSDKFALAPAARLDGQHVLILDDVWTTGSTAQSAALAVRRAGAAAISIMVVGRWLNPDRRLTPNFIATRLQHDYDPDICPVTGGDCP